MPRSAQGNLFAATEIDDAPAQFVSRPYVTQWVDSTIQSARTNNSGLLVAATGLGKTPFAGKLFERVLGGGMAFKFPGRKRRACLFVAHEGELVEQAALTFRDMLPRANVQIEQGKLKAGGEADIVVASRDTLKSPDRLLAFGPDRFDSCVVDECHRYPQTSSKWRRIRNFFNCHFTGVTATPDRGDEQSLQPSFEALIDYFPMMHAINEGWLVPVHQRYEYLTDLELDVTHRGDWTDDEVADRMQKTRPLATLVSVARKYGCMATRFRASRPVVVVCASPGIAELAAEQLNSWDKKESTGRAVCLHGKQQDYERDAANVAFKSGAARYLCIFQVGLEGYDYDEIGCVVNGRPTTRRYLIEQMAGRMVRPLKEIRDALAMAPDAAARRAIIAASRKPGGLFVDLTGTQLKLTMKMATMADVFAGRRLPMVGPDGDPLAVLKSRAVAANGMNNVAAAMGPDVEAERQKIRDAIRDGKAAEADKWAALGIRARTRHITINPFDLFDVRLLPASVIPAGRAASAKFRRVLENMGLEADVARRLTRRQAKQWMEIFKNRKRAGLCSYKQAKTLRKYGYNPDSTIEECRDAFDELKTNGWQHKKQS